MAENPLDLETLGGFVEALTVDDSDRGLVDACGLVLMWGTSATSLQVGKMTWEDVWEWDWSEVPDLHDFLRQWEKRCPSHPIVGIDRWGNLGEPRKQFGVATDLGLSHAALWRGIHRLPMGTSRQSYRSARKVRP